MKTYLGVDGGGTKTKFVLCDETGRILAENTQPTCHYLQRGLDSVTQVLRDGLSALCADSGTAPEDIAHAFVGCAGYDDVEEDKVPIEKAVAKGLPGTPHMVGNDSENAMAGALGGACGINLIAGTGSIGCGRNEAGAFLRCGGWHHGLLGDEGSGYWISIHLLWEFTRQSDGRTEQTPLYDAVRQALSLQSDGEVIKRVVEQWGMDRTKIAALSPLAGTLYAAGDPCAAAILEEGAEELASIASALYRKLGFTGTVPVSYTGGVFKMGAPILNPLERHLSNNHMRLTAPLLPPDRGALILALQADGVTITDEILKNMA